MSVVFLIVLALAFANSIVAILIVISIVFQIAKDYELERPNAFLSYPVLLGIGAIVGVIALMMIFLPMSTPSLIGLALALTHATVNVLIVISIAKGYESDWPMLWTYLLWLDFPASFVVYWSVGFVWQFALSKLMPSANASPKPAWVFDVNNFLLPLIVLGIGGTIWWFFLPQLIARVIT